jgi:GNAT superfamily N-acetyltransferase
MIVSLISVHKRIGSFRTQHHLTRHIWFRNFAIIDSIRNAKFLHPNFLFRYRSTKNFRYAKTFSNDRLTARGYTRGEDGNYYNIQYLDMEYIPQLPNRYVFTCATEVKDALSRHIAVYNAFHPGAGSPKVVPDSFLKMEKAPLFRPEFEIMTQCQDGTLTSFCVVWYDEKTKTGMFEPVATHPNHRKLGLGKAMLIEGLRRLKAIGANRACVESCGDNRKAFYNSAGFETYDKDCYWTKEF